MTATATKKKKTKKQKEQEQHRDNLIRISSDIMHHEKSTGHQKAEAARAIFHALGGKEQLNQLTELKKTWITTG